MFEGPLPSGVADDSGSTRVAAWSDLVAKLAAARDLRDMFARPGGDPACFAPQAARALALCEAGKGSVNPDALADRKGNEDITQAAAQPAGHGDRETR